MTNDMDLDMDLNMDIDLDMDPDMGMDLDPGRPGAPGARTQKIEKPIIVAGPVSAAQRRCRTLTSSAYKRSGLAAKCWAVMESALPRGPLDFILSWKSTICGIEAAPSLTKHQREKVRRHEPVWQVLGLSGLRLLQ